ncbi:hypothetical protein MWU60_02340 [Yoonia sp. F2084L]|uniref:hypothetical protein n=1 Tax=Yoonia sp. F2084L TaxID=2926419 RepID=UPI001FF2E9E8|nr:hypothetical protein [Yoonia sp. F2084L]MCK0094396.1 hypothetical protein [Yoonia sp. F2084L]
MNVAVTKIALGLGVIGLAACEEVSEPFAFDPTFATFADINSAFSAQTAALVNTDGALVNAGNISTATDFGATATGSVAYKGAIIASQTGTTDRMIGQLQLDVAFDTNTVSGTAGNFIHSTDGDYVGTLTGNGVIDRNVTGGDNHFDMAMTGALSNGGNSFAANVALEGNFLNGTDTIEAIAGDADLSLGDGAPEYNEGGFAVLR